MRRFTLHDIYFPSDANRGLAPATVAHPESRHPVQLGEHQAREKDSFADHQHDGLDTDARNFLQPRLHADAGDRRDQEPARDVIAESPAPDLPIQPVLLIATSTAKATANQGSSGGRVAPSVPLARVMPAARTITGSSIDYTHQLDHGGDVARLMRHAVAGTYHLRDIVDRSTEEHARRTRR